MKQVVIENPILNSPFHEPARHWRFTDEGITDEIAAGRRVSSYLVPIPPARGKGRQAQMALEYDTTPARIEENELINQIRARVTLWRQRGRPGGNAHHGAAPGALDRPGAGTTPVLLSDRSARDRHLSHRGGRQARRRVDRGEAAPR